jgi:hypothetical protein
MCFMHPRLSHHRSVTSTSACMPCMVLVTRIYIHMTIEWNCSLQMLLSHVEPLTAQQIVGVYGLRQSALETEEALNQGLDALYQSLSDTVVSDALSCPSNVASYMGQMAAAMNKLSTLEGFVRQVPHGTLHYIASVLRLSCSPNLLLL